MLPKKDPRIINVIGNGRIGAPVIQHIRQSAHLRLGVVLTRSFAPGSSDTEEFLASSADVVIDAAGPMALSQYAPLILRHSDLWSVSASALASENLFKELQSIASTHGTILRLFSRWIAAAEQWVPGKGGTIQFYAARPGLAGAPGIVFRGSLRNAALRYPNEVNSVVAAALCGAGLDNAEIELVNSGPGGAHCIKATVDTGFANVDTKVDLKTASKDSTHPTAYGIIAALERKCSSVRYG